MASSATYYTCSPYNTPQLLRNSGEEPLELTIRYVYEVDIPTATTEETTTTAALTNAIHHISNTLLQRMATISNLVDCSDTPNPFRQRQLRYKGRGSNSIIGLSSDPNTVWSDGVCQQQQLQAAEESEVEEMEKFMEGVTTGFSGSAVIMEEEEEEGDRGEPERQEEDSAAGAGAGAGAGDILAETRVDGVIDPANVVRSAPLLPNQPSSASSTKKQQLEEIQEAGSAYNYLSTLSEIQEFTSIRTQPNVGDNSLPGSSSISFLQSSVTMTPPKLRNGGSGGASGTTTTTTCNVIQGQMTLFISNNSDPFENLDGRILDAIKVDLNDEMIVQQEFLNEMVLGIRLLEPAMEKNSPSVSITTSAAAATTASSSNTNDAAGGLSSGFTSSYASIGVIAGLGGIFLILIGLFAYTSRPSKSRSRLSSSSSCDYGDDKYETEMDAKSALFIGKQSDYNMANDNFHSFSTDTSSGLEEEDEEQLSVIDMDDAPSVVVEESKSRKTKSFGRLFGRNKQRHSVDDSEDVMIDDDIVIEKVEAVQEGNDFGIGQTEIQEDAYGGIETTTTRTAPMRPMSAYISPTAVNSRPRCEKVYCTENNRTLQTCASGVTSCLTGIPAPEIGEDGSYDISALTDNDQYSRRGFVPGCDDQFSRRGLPTGCAPQATDGGEQFIRAAKGAMKQCVAPTDDQSVTTRSSSGANTRQLARRQPNVDSMDVFADCWNPFEGNFWQGWFD